MIIALRMKSPTHISHVKKGSKMEREEEGNTILKKTLCVTRSIVSLGFSVCKEFGAFEKL